MSNQKVFNAIVNVGVAELGNKGYITYHKISSLERFKLFLGDKYPQWKFATIYDHLTKSKIEVIKP
jgi:hypothetical protein